MLCNVFIFLPDDLGVFGAVLSSLEQSVLKHPCSPTYLQAFAHLCDLGDTVLGLDMQQETTKQGGILKPEVETLARARRDGVTAVACQDGCIPGDRHRFGGWTGSRSVFAVFLSKKKPA